MFKPRKRRWARGRNGLYGWRYSKQIYYICTGTPPRTEDTIPDEPAPTFLVLGYSASNGTRTITSTEGQREDRIHVSEERLREERNDDDDCS